MKQILTLPIPSHPPQTMKLQIPPSFIPNNLFLTDALPQNQLAHEQLQKDQVGMDNPLP